MTTPLLSVRNLRVNFETYDGEAKVINGIDLEIAHGETVAVVGETGCGKSVTAKSIMGLLPPTARVQGDIVYDGTDLTSLTEQQLHELRGGDICMIMQDPMTALNPVFTIGDQMVDVLRYQGKLSLSFGQWLRDKFRSDEYLKEQAIQMLEKTRIPAPDNVFERYPHELSGGMRQRVLISIALLSEPHLLIADEPTTALDATTEQSILKLLKNLVDEFHTSMIYITHDLSVAKEISDRIAVMYAGDMVESGPTEDILRRPKHPYTRGLIDSLPKISGEMGTGIEGSIPNFVDPPPACRFADRCDYAENACRAVYPYPRRVNGQRTVACHLYQGQPANARFEDYAKDHPVDIGQPPWQRDEQTTTAQEEA